MKAYSQDLRQRVLRAIDAGASQGEVAETFAISIATIKRYLKQRRETGHVQPKAIPGRPKVVGTALEAGLLEQLHTYPDATREQHCQMWEATHGIKVSPASITRARQALGWTRKKRRSAPVSSRKPNAPPGVN
jgi:transposase